MSKQSNKALIVIDLQNDYFPGGRFPLWNTETVLSNIENTIHTAYENNIAVIHVQHIANPEMGIAPFFNKDTHGADIHPTILKAAPHGVVVVKEFADSFEGTTLDNTLKELNVNEIILCGMMTQNCVTHTALSKKADKYKVSVLADCTTTVDEMIHNVALHAMSTRVPFLTNEALL